MANDSASELVCQILWQSVSGWDNRPEYFDTNTLMLIGDLAYWATRPDYAKALAHALSADSITCASELSCSLQRSDCAVHLYPLLKEIESGPIGLMASLEEYEKYRLKEKSNA